MNRETAAASRETERASTPTLGDGEKAGDTDDRSQPGRGQSQRPTRIKDRSSLVGGLGVAMFLVVTLIFFTIVADNFATSGNVINILATASVVLMVSLGQAMTIISGGFDLSVGGVVPLGAVTYAVFTSNGWPPLVALVAVVLIGCLVGLVNALLIGWLGINPLIATLGTYSVTGGIAFTIARGVTVQIPPEAGRLGEVGPWNVPYYVFVAVLLAVLVHVLLSRTTLGRRIYVVGGNAEAARVAGIRVGLVHLAVYSLSGALAAFSGLVLASQLLAAAGNVGTDAMLTSIAAVVLGGAALSGGKGGIPGTILGVLILGSVADGMSLMRVPAYYQQIVTGLVLLTAVGFSRLQETLSSRAHG